MSPFQERLRELCSTYNITQADIVRKTGISKCSISMYFSGARKPMTSAVVQIASAFRINPAWLMGYDVPMNEQSPSPIQKDAETDARLITMFRCLSDNDKAFVMQLVERLNNKDIQ